MGILIIIGCVGVYIAISSFINTRDRLAVAELRLRSIPLHQLEIQKLNKTNSELVAECERIKQVSVEQEQLYQKLITDFETGSNQLAELSSDFKTALYEISAKYLEEKKHPAHTEALRIRELKTQTRDIIRQNRLMEYKYEYLFRLFPDLELYAENLSAIKDMGKFEDLDDLEENFDRTRHYLTKEEWAAMPVDARNQLALDRYIERRKSTWQIGRDYEMYVGYTYEIEGWDVEYCGIEKRLEDMGRDLITQRNGITHIVQCKFWADYKEIHEKHIAQLYGTTIQYILSTKKSHVLPVFITNITLSPTARQFAEYLKVTVIESKQLKTFPRIKCNINRDEYGSVARIYHLPMDQQYDRTKISKPGEFFAFTVKEAVSNGFRRAKKYFGPIG